MKLANLVSISNESAAVHIETHSKSGSIMNKKLKFNFHTVVILPIARLLAFSGCSSTEGKVENPRVHPGQPYNRGLWPDP